MTESPEHPPVGFSNAQITPEADRVQDPNWFDEEVVPINDNSDGDFDGDDGPLCIPFTRAHSEEIITQSNTRQQYKIIKDWLFGSVLGEGRTGSTHSV